MQGYLKQLIRSDARRSSASLFTNAGFLILNTLLGSLFGYVFWLIATRLYNPVEIGIGAAYISAITLLSTLGDMGLGITVIRFAPSLDQEKIGFFNTSAIAVAISTLIFSVGFIMTSHVWSPELNLTEQASWLVVAFVVAALSFSLAQFADRLYIAFERSYFLLIRNLLFNVIRIAFIVIFARQLKATGLLLAVGGAALITLIISISFYTPRVLPGYRIANELVWGTVYRKAKYTIGNHISQLLWSLPALVYPLIVLKILGAKANAQFYTSWMIANLLFILPTALSTSVFANISNTQDSGHGKIWKIMWWTLLGVAPVVVVLIPISGLVLGFFGSEYASGGRALLTLLLLSIFPYTVLSYMIVDYRIRQETRALIWLTGLTAIVCLVLVIIFGSSLGMIGVGIGWISGITFGMLFGIYVYFIDKLKISSYP